MNKPFDLTKPVQTRDGNSVRILCTDVEDSDFPVVSLVKRGKSEALYRHTLKGSYYRSRPDPNDLVNVPVKHQRTGWINCYPATLCIHQIKDDADAQRSQDCIACVPITINFEEGDGL